MRESGHSDPKLIFLLYPVGKTSPNRMMMSTLCLFLLLTFAKISTPLEKNHGKTNFSDFTCFENSSYIFVELPDLLILIG